MSVRWLMTAGGLLALAVLAFVMVNREEGWLAAGLVIIGGIYAALLFRRDRTPRRYDRLVLVALLVSIAADLYLLENYLYALSGQADGIAVANEFSYLLLGEDGWSVERFHDTFSRSMDITLALVILYALLLLRTRN